MKILWFSLSPCGSMRRNNTTKFTQTWMVTLEDELKKNTEIKLSVAYFSNTDDEPFLYDNVMYYPMSVASHSYNDKLRNIWGGTDSQNNLKLKLMKKVLELCKPDLIHIHGTESCFGLISQYVGNIPLVYSLQGVMSSISEKYFAGYEKIEASNTDTFRDYVFAKTAKKMYTKFLKSSGLERDFLKNTNYVIGRTDLDRSISMLLNPKRKYYVVNEIMRKEFMESVWQAPTNRTFKIVSVLSAGIYKGYPTLLKAASLLTHYADFEFEWNVIGCDVNDKWVKAAILKTGVRPEEVHVNLLGKQTAPFIVEKELLSNLYIHTGQTENSPNTVCEAMCLGMPIIATFAGGTSSILEHKHEGYLVQDGDAFALAGAIVEAHKHYNQYINWGKNARQHAITRHNAANVVEELTSAYKAILNDHKL